MLGTRILVLFLLVNMGLVVGGFTVSHNLIPKVQSLTQNPESYLYGDSPSFILPSTIIYPLSFFIDVLAAPLAFCMSAGIPEVVRWFIAYPYTVLYFSALVNFVLGRLL